MDKFSSIEGINEDQIKARTKYLLEFFKKKFLESKSTDFASDAITNMIVCNSVYVKIFEGYLAISNRRNMPQEMTDGFAKWSTEQLDELKIRLKERYEKTDMR